MIFATSKLLNSHRQIGMRPPFDNLLQSDQPFIILVNNRVRLPPGLPHQRCQRFRERFFGEKVEHLDGLVAARVDLITRRLGQVEFGQLSVPEDLKLGYLQATGQRLKNFVAV